MTDFLQIEWTTDAGSTEVLDFDAVVHESYEAASEVAEHAVERGASIADHVRPQAETFSIEAWVTNTPVTQKKFGMYEAAMQPTPMDVRLQGQSITVTTLQATSKFDRQEAVDSAMRQLRTDAKLLTIRSPRTLLEQVVLTSYKVERAGDGTAALQLSLELKQVRIASTERVQAAQPRRRREQKPRERGEQHPEPETRHSLASSLLRSIGAIH